MEMDLKVCPSFLNLWLEVPINNPPLKKRCPVQNQICQIDTLGMGVRRLHRF